MIRIEDGGRRAVGTRLALASVAALTVGMGLACGGMDDMSAIGGGAGGMAVGGGTNQAACVNYIETQNKLPCMSAVQQDPATVCPPGQDVRGAPDLSKYYNCMADAVKCNGDIPDMSGVADCAKFQTL